MTQKMRRSERSAEPARDGQAQSLKASRPHEAFSVEAKSTQDVSLTCR